MRVAEAGLDWTFVVACPQTSAVGAVLVVAAVVVVASSPYDVVVVVGVVESAVVSCLETVKDENINSVSIFTYIFRLRYINNTNCIL